MFLFFLTEAFAAEIVSIPLQDNTPVFADRRLHQEMIAANHILMEWSFDLDAVVDPLNIESTIYFATRVELRAILVALEQRGARDTLKLLNEGKALRRLQLLSNPCRLGAPALGGTLIREFLEAVMAFMRGLCTCV